VGMFQVRVKVSNPYDSLRFFEEKFWVDTGALYSYIPEDRPKDIGLAPSMTKAFRHADMRRERLLVGEAMLTIFDPSGIRDVPRHLRATWFRVFARGDRAREFRRYGRLDGAGAASDRHDPHRVTRSVE
jgi:hypothetical protein